MKSRLTLRRYQGILLAVLIWLCHTSGATEPLPPDGVTPQPSSATTLRLEVLRLEVDATQMARHLLTSTTHLKASAGEFALWFPEWIPGIHGPSEQIRNMGGLNIFAADGSPLPWRRDPLRLNRFLVSVPSDQQISVELTYIANQPTRVSTGVDSFGNSELLAINFNTCVVYPDGVDLQQLPAELQLKLPRDYKFASSLQVASQAEQDADQVVRFKPTTVELLVDSPLIAGRHFAQIVSEIPGHPRATYHFVSEDPLALAFDETLPSTLTNLMREAYLLFGSAPYDAYEFLVICSDRVPGMGLEHHSSSLNAVDLQGIVDSEKRKSRAAYLLPHELVHAWCGKYRRPAGMFRADFHSPKETAGLWIYEGLTQYLGQVLAVRSGLIDFDEHLQSTAARIGYLANRTGRAWRPLEDTAVAGHTLRGGSNAWNDLRRSQDYYDEGAFFWMEADAIIRQRSQSTKSLDDFCRRFFARAKEDPHVKPFEMAEVIETLEQVQTYDWRGLIDRRIKSPQVEFPTPGLAAAGYQFSLTPEKPDYVARRDKDRKLVSAEFSVGLILKNSGEIASVTPGGPADQAKMIEGQIVIGVNHRKFSTERFVAAMNDSKDSGEIHLLVEDGDVFRQFRLRDDGGPKYPLLARLGQEADIFREICAPLASPSDE